MAPSAAAAESINRRDQRSSGWDCPSIASDDAEKADHCRPPVQPSSTTVATGAPSAKSGTRSPGTGWNPPRAAMASEGRTAAIVVSFVSVAPIYASLGRTEIISVLYLYECLKRGGTE